MDLRDYFAAKAMQGLITAGWSNPGAVTKAYQDESQSRPLGEKLDFRFWLAAYAYEQADAMLKARQA